MSQETEPNQDINKLSLLQKRPFRDKLMAFTAFVKDKWSYVQCAVFVGFCCFIPSLITSSISSLTRGGDFSSSLIISASVSLLGVLAGIDVERHERWLRSSRFRRG